MTYYDLVIMRGKGTTESCCSITLNYYNIRMFLLNHSIQSLNRVFRNLRQTLTKHHNIQIMIRPNVKERHNLIKHLLMLCSRTNFRNKVLRSTLNLLDYRRKFNGFWSGANYG